MKPENNKTFNRDVPDTPESFSNGMKIIAGTTLLMTAAPPLGP